jgi:hypothetical protein
MFSSHKILKPDVPPKRRKTAPGFFGRLFRLLPFFPPRHLLPIGNAITEERSAPERKVFRRNGA